ncbi:MAG: ProP effector [Paraburkholderia sp.]|nr:ProP effector [Paraburkholderia sp.]
MGFEQLAALKDQLAKQAERERVEKTSRVRRPAPAANQSKPVANKSKPVDPVVLAIAKLQKRFPLAFPRKPASKVPLKIGIFEDLVKHEQELGLSESELREAISTWCRGTRYWTCLVEGAARIDLAGAASGQVLSRDASRARRLRSGRGARPAAADDAKKSVTEPLVTEPLVTEPLATEPLATEPVTEPLATEPVTEPSATASNDPT